MKCLVFIFAILLTTSPVLAKPSSALICLAKTIYFEARSEPIEGQIAVAQVVFNRVLRKHWKDTICGVVYSGGEERGKCQFKWYCDGKSDNPKEIEVWTRIIELAWRLLIGVETKDFSNGATFFQATGSDIYLTVNCKVIEITAVIGSHVFFRCISTKRATK